MMKGYVQWNPVYNWKDYIVRNALSFYPDAITVFTRL